MVWLEEARPRLALQPRPVMRTDTRLCLKFDYTTSDIEVELSRSRWRSRPYDYRLYVWHSIGRSYIDSYLCLSTEVQRVGRGYGDTSQAAEERRIYPSREELWRDILFEPFLKWVNEELSPASGIAEGSSLMEWIPLSSYNEMEGQRPVNEAHWIANRWLVREGEPLESADQKVSNVIPLRCGGLVPRRRRGHRPLT
jgi:hypothetical protein